MTPAHWPRPTRELPWEQAPTWPRRPETSCCCGLSPPPFPQLSSWPAPPCASCDRILPGPRCTTCSEFPLPPACFTPLSISCSVPGLPPLPWPSARSACSPTACACAAGIPLRSAREAGSLDSRSFAIKPRKEMGHGEFSFRLASRFPPVRILTRYILGEILSHAL